MGLLQLSLPDVQRLHGELVALFDVDAFEELLKLECGRSLRNLASNGRYPLQVVEVLEQAQQQGWVAQLIEAARKERPQSAVFADLAVKAQKQAAAAARALAIDPYEVVWLPRSRPFVNRTGFRATTRRLLTQGAAGVCIVRGQSQTGRSHSRFFLQHLSRRESFEVIEIDLRKVASDETEVNAYQLAVNLDQGLSLEFPFGAKDTENPVIFKIEPFAQNFLRVLRERPAARYVLVFDGFGQVEPTESGLRLIHRFVDMAEGSETLWVYLLGHQEDLPLSLGCSPVRDETADFTQEDVANFFERFYHQVLDQPAPDPAAIVNHTVEALRATAPGKTKVAAVGGKIAEICSGLIQS